MPRIAFIGAGSTVFAKNLLGDILSFEELAESTIALFDIAEDRLATTEIVAHKAAESVHANPRITATTDRREALDGADYAICMVQVGGYKPCTVTDFEIPKRYGLRQTIGDTLGIGGIMRGLRTVPVLLDICRDMQAVCPEVTFLNYANPMAINCAALARLTPIRTVGLCHSVQGTAEEMARDIRVPIDEIDYLCAGINHMAFYLKFAHKNGEDLYPRIRQVIEEGRVPEKNLVRYKMLEHLGYFVTESSEHFAEYVPWFIKRDRPDLVAQYNIPLDEYLARCEDQLAKWDDLRKRLEDQQEPLGVLHSSEYCSFIIHSMETGEPSVVYGNVPNRGLISNLPETACVEVPCLVDGNGVQPTQVGKLPPQLAAMMQTNINVQELTVEAIRTGRREHIYHAAMLDPHTAAELDLDQICTLVDELLAAHKDWIPPYST